MKDKMTIYCIFFVVRSIAYSQRAEEYPTWKK